METGGGSNKIFVITKELNNYVYKIKTKKHFEYLKINIRVLGIPSYDYVNGVESYF